MPTEKLSTSISKPPGVWSCAHRSKRLMQAPATGPMTMAPMSMV